MGEMMMGERLKKRERQKGRERERWSESVGGG